jgi:1-acyl-sn-glycerol-3-phosphate acyltransferase
MGVLLLTWRAGVLLAQLLYGLWLVKMRMPRLAPAEWHAVVGRFHRRTLAGIGVELRVSGTACHGPVLVVSNHVSWLDIMALHAAAPQLRFVSKSDIASWPLVGPLALAGGTLFIERERKRDALRVVHELAAALSAADAVVVFPEGTTGPGDVVLPFHANLLQAAIATGTRVQPAVLRYSEPGHDFSLAAQFVGDTTLTQSLWKILTARGLVVHVQFMEPETPGETDRRVLAARLQARIEERLPVMLPASPPG